MKVINLLLLVYMLPTANAYIDPGTGGMIFTSFGTWLLGILSAFIFLVLIRPLKFIKKKLKL